jgi:hypothetical protein
VNHILIGMIAISLLLAMLTGFARRNQA